MKEMQFIDRVPTYPGRVVMTPVPGKANTYDMVRADEPRVAGVPLGKALFDSIVQSRLTGRYYDMSVSKNVLNNQSHTVNPIPTNGWVLNEAKTQATSGDYTVTVNSLYGTYTPEKALDGSMNTEYRSDATGEITFAITFPAAIKIKKYKLAMRADNYTYSVTTELQGSTDGTHWTTLFTTNEKPDNLKEYTLTSTGEYSRYRLKFTASETGVNIYEFQISSYDVATYTNAFKVADVFPTNWTTGQRVTVQTPTTFSTLAVTANSLNGVPVNTILQPNKRYELRYTGSAFVAKEV